MNTKYKFFSHQAIELGNVIRNHRDSLHLLPGSRQAFIDYQIKKGLLPSGWLSEKELMNIELGHKLPGLITFKIARKTALAGQTEDDWHSKVLDYVQEVAGVE
jgi:hypothetical protein